MNFNCCFLDCAPIKIGKDVCFSACAPHKLPVLHTLFRGHADALHCSEDLLSRRLIPWTFGLSGNVTNGAGADGPHGTAVSPGASSRPHSEGWFEGSGVRARHNHWRQCLDWRRSHYFGCVCYYEGISPLVRSLCNAIGAGFSLGRLIAQHTIALTTRSM